MYKSYGFYPGVISDIMCSSCQGSQGCIDCGWFCVEEARHTLTQQQAEGMCFL